MRRESFGSAALSFLSWANFIAARGLASLFRGGEKGIKKKEKKGGKNKKNKKQIITITQLLMVNNIR